MISMILGGLAGITLGAALIALITWPRRITTRALRPIPAARFYTMPGGTRWLPCHTTTCGHMTTVHTPHGSAWRCDGCGDLKGEQ